MSTILDRPSFPVTLPDGRTCRVQRVGGIEYVEALKAGGADEESAGITAVTESNVAYWSMMCFYGVVEPKLEDAGRYAALLSTDDLRYITQRIEYRSGLRDDPDKPVDQPGWDEPLPDEGEGKGAPTDPLVDEFPARVDAAGEGVGGDVDVVPQVSVSAESVGGGESGGASDDAGVRSGAVEADGVA